MTLTVEQVGRRVYVVGDTFSLRERLKQAGCSWDADRRQWWIGAARRQAVVDIVAKADVSPQTAYKKASPEELSNLPCHGKVTYKNRQYYVVGRTRDGVKLHLTVLDCSIDFWAAASDCAWARRYTPHRSDRRYGDYRQQTVGRIRAFVSREEAAKQRGDAVCAECGRTGELVYDHEDGLMKHRRCCDIPEA